MHCVLITFCFPVLLMQFSIFWVVNPVQNTTGGTAVPIASSLMSSQQRNPSSIMAIFFVASVCGRTLGPIRIVWSFQIIGSHGLGFSSVAGFGIWIGAFFWVGR